jgi:hypothetical protein
MFVVRNWTRCCLYHKQHRQAGGLSLSNIKYPPQETGIRGGQGWKKSICIPPPPRRKINSYEQTHYFQRLYNLRGLPLTWNYYMSFFSTAPDNMLCQMLQCNTCVQNVRCCRLESFMITFRISNRLSQCSLDNSKLLIFFCWYCWCPLWSCYS